MDGASSSEAYDPLAITLSFNSWTASLIEVASSTSYTLNPSSIWGPPVASSSRILSLSSSS
jgi:hypothetical protein